MKPNEEIKQPEFVDGKWQVESYEFGISKFDTKDEADDWIAEYWHWAREMEAN